MYNNNIDHSAADAAPDAHSRTKQVQILLAPAISFSNSLPTLATSPPLLLLLCTPPLSPALCPPSCAAHPTAKSPTQAHRVRRQRRRLHLPESSRTHDHSPRLHLLHGLMKRGCSATGQGHRSDRLKQIRIETEARADPSEYLRIKSGEQVKAEKFVGRLVWTASPPGVGSYALEITFIMIVEL